MDLFDFLWNLDQARRQIKSGLRSFAPLVYNQGYKEAEVSHGL
jgi:hypothetical protein